MKKALTFVISTFLLFNVTNVKALENSTLDENASDSKWSVEKKTFTNISEGIEYSAEFDMCKKIYKGEEVEDFCVSENGSILATVLITIPADYKEEKLIIRTKIFDLIAEATAGETIRLVPGYSFRYDIKIINNSKYSYKYVDESYEIYPIGTQESIDLGYKELEGNIILFNGEQATTLNQFKRVYNEALKDLLERVEKYSSFNAKKIAVDDVKLNEILKNHGYNSLYEYYLDFYNHKAIGYVFKGTDLEKAGSTCTQNSECNIVFGYGTDEKPYVKSLEEFNERELAMILGAQLYTYYGVKDDGTLANGSSDSNQRLEITETDSELIKVHFNSIYNSNISITTGDKEIPTGPDYNMPIQSSTSNDSIGNTMRDNSKINEGIKETIEIIEGNSSEEDNEIFFNISFNGPHIGNSYQAYKMMVDDRLYFGILKGNLVIRYVDTEGNDLIKSVIETNYVGETYETNSKEIDNWELIEVKGQENGIYIEGTSEVIYVYKHLTGNVITKFVDTEGNELAESIIETNYVGEAYETTAKEFEFATLVAIDGEEVGTFTKEDIIVTYIYEYKKNVGNGDDVEVLPPQTGITKENNKYSILTALLILLLVVLKRI